MSLRLWITGATGYLGRELALLRSDADTTRVDVRDPDAVLAHVAASKPDVIIHTAYRQVDPDSRAINVEGAGHVAEAAEREDVRLIHLSTDVVFDGRKGTPYVEKDPPSAVTEYGREKADAERVVAAAWPEALVVRTSLIYGGPGHEPSKHELLARDPDATFYTTELRCPVQVGDLSAALLELVDSYVPGILHVAGPDGVSRAEFARLIRGAPVPEQPAPPERPLDCRLDSSHAVRLLSTRLRGVREVLAGTARPAAK